MSPNNQLSQLELRNASTITMKLFVFIAVCVFVCWTESNAQTIDPRIRTVRQLPHIPDLQALPMNLGNPDIMETVQGMQAAVGSAGIPDGLDLAKLPPLPIAQG